MPQLHVVPPGGFPPQDGESVFAAFGAAVHLINARLSGMAHGERCQFLSMLRTHCDAHAGAARAGSERA